MESTGYEDLDKLYSSQNEALENQKQMQNDIIDKQTDVQVNRLDFNKQQYEDEANKEAKGLYADYAKESGAYGVRAENRAEQGLANSGYAESSQVNLYNTYQQNVTEVMNQTNKLKAQVDLEINEAYANADIQKAQASLTLYQQQAELALQVYQFKQNRDQFEWQKSTWQQEFDYKKQRDAVSDSQWERQYQLSLQNS